MIKLGDTNPTRIGHELADLLKTLGIPDRDVQSTVINMLVALVEAVPQNNSTAYNWAYEVSVTALQHVAHSQIQEVMLMVRNTLRSGSDGKAYIHIGPAITLGDTIAVSGVPGVTWEVLEIGPCRKHSPLEPEHLSYRVVNHGHEDVWVCSHEATKVEEPADDTETQLS